MFETLRRRNSFSGPAAALAAMLAISLLLALLPRSAVEPLRAMYTRMIEPARLAGGWLHARGAMLAARWEHASATAEEAAQYAEQVRRLEERNLELAASVLQRQETPAADTSNLELPPLVLADCLRARVLGTRSCALLRSSEIIAAGRQAGTRPDALVLADSATTIDGGQDAQVLSGDLALVGRRVYGKVVEVGPHTAVVRRANDSGYRDVVQLAQADGATPRLGAKGILEGTGDRLCRLRMISATIPVEVGDLVFTAGDEGVTPQPLLYGAVVRVEQQSSVPHWEIWVEPAVVDRAATHLLVLRVRLNPARVAAAEASR